MPLVAAGAHPILSGEAGGADDKVILVFPDAGSLISEVIFSRRIFLTSKIQKIAKITVI
jgi:hypothetical protein